MTFQAFLIRRAIINNSKRVPLVGPVLTANSTSTAPAPLRRNHNKAAPFIAIFKDGITEILVGLQRFFTVLAYSCFIVK